MRYLNRVLLLVAVVFLMSLSACSKKESASDSLFENEIISKLPPSTFAFYTYNARRASFSKFKERPESKQFGNLFQDWREVAAAGEGKVLKNVITVMETLGLSANSQDISRQAEVFVAFASIGGEKNPFGGGVYLGLPKKRTAEAVLEQLKTDLGEQQVKFVEQKLAGADGISFRLDNGANESGLELYAVGRGDKFALVSDVKLVKALLSDAEPQPDQLLKTEAFKSVQKIIPASKDSFMYGFINIKPAVSFIQPLLAANPELRQQALDLNDLPFDSVGYVASVAEQIESIVAVPLVARNEVQKNFIKRVQGSKGADMAAVMPANALMMLAVNGDLIKAAMEVSKAAVAGQPQFAKYQQLVKDAQVLSLGVRNNPLAPFPDIILMVKAVSGSQMLESVVSELKSLSQGFGMGQAWQKRDIDGYSVNSVLTPLGVGIFASQVGDYVVLTSSEAAIKEIGSVVKSGKGGLSEAFGKSARGFGSESGVVVVNYFNFPLLADAVATLGGTLAMFTGGQPFMEPEQIEELRKIGKMAVAFKLDGEALKIQTRISQ